jgi:ureidoglycolate hydrolase
METGFFTQQESRVNGRGVWHYLVHTPIGDFNIVEYEQRSKELKRFIFDGWYEKAERKYQNIIKGIVNGTI